MLRLSPVLSPRKVSLRRDKLSIITDMLKTATHGAVKTRIMYKANMSYTAVNDYLSFLLTHHLLSGNIEGDRLVYRPTEKGLTILSRYIMLLADIEN